MDMHMLSHQTNVPMDIDQCVTMSTCDVVCASVHK
jgi:ferredoxin-like protein FixX